MFVGAVVREAKQPNPNPNPNPNPLTLTLRPFDPESCVLRFDSRSVRQLNTNELTPASHSVGSTASGHRLPFLSNFFKLQEYSAYILLHFFLQRPMN